MPNAKVLEQKQQLVAELSEKLGAAVTGVIVDYKVQQEGEKFNYWRSLKDFVKNRAAMSFTLVSIFQLLTMAFMTNASSLFIQQTFPNFASMSGIVSLLGFVPTFFVIPFVGKLVRKFGMEGITNEDISAKYENGVLLVTIKKPEEKKASKIEIQ